MDCRVCLDRVARLDPKAMMDGMGLPDCLESPATKVIGVVSAPSALLVLRARRELVAILVFLDLKETAETLECRVCPATLATTACLVLPALLGLQEFPD